MNVSSITQPLRSAVERAGGFAGGIVGAAVHAPMGAVDGMWEGLSPDGHAGDAWTYRGVGFGTSLVGGTALSVATGGAAPLFLTAAGYLAGNWVASQTGADQHWCTQVAAGVDQAIADNTGAPIKVAVQNLVEGALVGAGTGAREGQALGRQVGEGLASGTCDFVAGVAEGIWQVFKP